MKMMIEFNIRHPLNYAHLTWNGLASAQHVYTMWSKVGKAHKNKILPYFYIPMLFQ